MDIRNLETDRSGLSLLQTSVIKNKDRSVTINFQDRANSVSVMTEATELPARTFQIDINEANIEREEAQIRIKSAKHQSI